MPSGRRPLSGVLTFLQGRGTLGVARWLGALAVLLPVALTCPAFEPDYGPGLDSSYIWGLNWLFSNDYSRLIELIYPFGPLTLLLSPTIENGHFLLFLTGYTLLKLLFTWLALRMATERGHNLGLAALAVTAAMVVCNVDFVVPTTALLVLRSLERRNAWWWTGAAVLAALGLYIKISIGVAALSVLFMGWAVSAWRSRNLKTVLLQAAAVAVALLAVGMSVYHTPRALLQGLTGMVHLTLDYGSALVLEPDYCRWALWVALAILMAYPWVVRKGSGRLLWLLFLLPLYANWQHAIVREDFFHFKQLAAFTATMAALLPLAQERVENGKWRVERWSWLWMWGCVGLLIVNLYNMPDSKGRKLTRVRPQNGWNVTVEYPQLADRCRKNIEENKHLYRLPESTLNLIGDGSVDCYPWDHFFAAANDLRWQPRATMGTALSHWLEEQSAYNFSGGDEAVDNILLHRTDNDLQTLDGCYLLNDEPLVVDAWMQHYRVADSGWYGLLLSGERRTEKGEWRAENEVLQGRWGEWFELPSEADWCRVAVSSKLTFWGSLRSRLYKPDLYYVDYLMPDSSVVTYRYLPSTARDGLWTGPLVRSHAELAQLLEGGEDLPKPLAIRLHTSHPAMQKNGIELTLKHFSIVK